MSPANLPKNVLIASRHRATCNRLARDLRGRGYGVVLAHSLQQTANHIEKSAPHLAIHVALLDLDLGRTVRECMALIRRLRRASPHARVAVMVPRGALKAARLALKDGAAGYLFRPVTGHAAHDFVEATLDCAALEKELHQCSGWLRAFVGQNLNIGVSVIDRSYRIRYFNKVQKTISAPGMCRLGICWMEYNRDLAGRQPCPWCPVRLVFEDGKTHESTTISPVRGQPRFFHVTACPVKDPGTGEVVAAVELVQDCTESMVEECRGAILKGHAAFRKAMETMLERMCKLGFDRARLYIEETWDPRYLKGLASHGTYLAKIGNVVLDLKNDYYFAKTKKDPGVHRYSERGRQGAPGMEKIRKPETPWLEVALNVIGKRGTTAFVGKLCFDNETSGRPLECNKAFWSCLNDYADKLAPVVSVARDHWRRLERAHRAKALSRLDKAVLHADSLERQMQAIVKCANQILKPDHCHIRIRRGNKLVLIADTSQPTRVRKEVDIVSDRDTSVSVRQARSRKPEKPTFLTQRQLRAIAERLHANGRLRAAKYFEKMRSCGVFALMEERKDAIGTVVIDSVDPYFFDAERKSAAVDLVRRAQVLVESNSRREQAAKVAALADLGQVSRTTGSQPGKRDEQNLARALWKPMNAVVELFGADRGVLIELLSLKERGNLVCVWSKADARNKKRTPDDPEIRAFTGMAGMSERLGRGGYIAFGNTDQDSPLPKRLVSWLQKAPNDGKSLDIRTGLAVPVCVRGELWGTLVLVYSKSVHVSPRDVQLVQRAATQIGLSISESQHVKLRDIDTQIGSEIGNQLDSVLKKILFTAIELTACQRGGHIRMADWFNNELVLRVDSLEKRGKPPWRRIVPIGAPVAGIVAESGVERIAHDMMQDRYGKALLRQVPRGRKDIADFLKKQQSYACLPLTVNGEILGTMSLSGVHRGQFTERRLDQIKDFTARAGMALLSARNLERMREMAEEMDKILKVDRLEDLWSRIPAATVKLFQAEDAAVSSYDSGTNLLRRQARYNDNLHKAGKDDIGAEVKPSTAGGCGLTRYVCQMGLWDKPDQSLRLAGDEARKHPSFSRIKPHREKFLPSKDLKSVMVSCLKTPDGKVMGVLKVENRKGRLGNLGFTEFDEALMSHVSKKFAIAIEWLRLLEAKESAALSQVHDLRRPAYAIRTILYNFVTKVYTLPEHEAWVTRAHRHVKMLGALINSTLDVARGVVRYVGPVALANIPKLVDDVVDLFQPFQHKHEWTIRSYVPMDCKSLIVDEDALSRILINLVDNSKKHYPKDAKSSSRRYAKKITIRFRKTGRIASVEVADRGPGIPKQARDRVFQPGYQLQPSGNAGRKVRGIGLTAVRLLADSLCGGVQILDRSDGASGTVVRMWWKPSELARHRAQKQQEQEGEGSK